MSLHDRVLERGVRVNQQGDGLWAQFSVVSAMIGVSCLVASMPSGMQNQYRYKKSTVSLNVFCLDRLYFWH